MIIGRASSIRTPLLTRSQSRAVDGALMYAGVPGIVLMENAGRGAADGIHALAKERGITRATVLVGPGHNGGDALVVARHLLLAGFAVNAITLGDPKAMRGDAGVMRDAWLAVGGSLEIAPRDLAPDTRDWVPAGAELLIDGLFGTGLSRPLDNVARSIVIQANRYDDRALSIALDIPSGLNADTGGPHGDELGVFRATHTFAFGSSKPGLHTGFGVGRSGSVRVVTLGAALPSSIDEAHVFLVQRETAPVRALDAHKGDNGRVLIIGGSPGTTGAAVLAARGAHRAGAGLVTIATRAYASIDAKVVETMCTPLSDQIEEATNWLQSSLARFDAVVVGPGLGRDEWAAAVLEATLSHGRCVVLDADALNLLATRGTALGEGVRVLTPHPLEMARLLGHDDAARVNGDRLRAARDCAKKFRATVVLKGAGTIVATPDGPAYIADCAEPALAVAGSGDVLAGVIGARVAERAHQPAIETAVLQAVLAHGRAGQRIRASRQTARGALASEIADQVGPALEDRS